MATTRSKLASRIVDKLAALPHENRTQIERTYAKSYSLAFLAHTGLCTVTATGGVYLNRLERIVDAETKSLIEDKK